ncbi:hypothetical protein AVEN_118496-1 [Araneus ventricosus]|uniref:Uncharacterized protein n=1 Tax=Araneus ventricosus TaxID=182803 RepID=A0A4Y2WVJ3_ARAVE|nr:hypothetical protein AVEN_45161-1 [Araneus ventricosus]GBO40824.1 hypothetical protein AVEN_118496-1 [Araneus ventricosus]
MTITEFCNHFSKMPKLKCKSKSAVKVLVVPEVKYFGGREESDSQMSSGHTLDPMPSDKLLRQGDKKFIPPFDNYLVNSRNEYVEK